MMRCHRCGMSMLAHDIAIGDDCEGWLRQKALGGLQALSRLMFWVCLEFEFSRRLRQALTKNATWGVEWKERFPRREYVFLDTLGENIHLVWR